MSDRDGPQRVTIDELVVGDDPDAWRAAGFTVDGDGRCQVGSVRLRLAGSPDGRGLRAWSLRVPADAATDGGEALGEEGLPTMIRSSSGSGGASVERAASIDAAAAEAPSMAAGPHPCGATQVDHVVVLTPDGARTTAAVTAATGLTVRRVRDTERRGTPLRQHFFRFGEVILEVVATVPSAPGPASFFGLAFVVDDLDALAARLGDHLGPVTDAVQPGRRVATLRHKALGLSVPVLFMTPEPPRP